MRDGALAYLETVNRQGGINGRKIELMTLDDAGQTKVGRGEHQKAHRGGQGLSVVRIYRRNTSEAALPIIGAAKHPVFRRGDRRREHSRGVQQECFQRARELHARDAGAGESSGGHRPDENWK